MTTNRAKRFYAWLGFDHVSRDISAHAANSGDHGLARRMLSVLSLASAVNVAKADSYSELMVYAPVNVSDYKALLIVALSIIFSFLCGMVCVGCCWWKFGTTMTQRSTNSRAMQKLASSPLEVKSQHVWCSPHGERFHGTENCSGLRNAKSYRKYGRCLLCG